MIPRTRSLTVLLTCFLAAPAWAIVPGQTSELPTTGDWSGTNWSLSTTGVYGWNSYWNGTWYTGTAVAVAPNYLLTAGHVDGKSTDYALIDGVRYTAVESFTPPNDPGQSAPPDLRLIRVDKTLPTYVPLFTGELTRHALLTILGFGETGTVSGGWATWQPGTKGTGRWGTNVIDDASRRLTGNGYSTEAFKMIFNNSTPYEAIAADGDSGGGVFIKSGDQWQLAGIITNATYSQTWAVSVPHYQQWIQSVIVVPEPSMLSLLVAAPLVLRRRRLPS